MYSIYAHINKINGKIYIGQSSSPKNRWKGKGISYKGCYHFYNAINKYGWDNFHHIILYSGLTKDEVNKVEAILIENYSKLGISYNIAPGGFGVVGPRTETHKNNISKALKGVPKSEIAKKHMRENASHHGGKEVIMFDRNGTFIKLFKTCGLASKETNIKVTHIARCARGIRPSAGGYIWKYKNKNYDEITKI